MTVKKMANIEELEKYFEMILKGDSYANYRYFCKLWSFGS